MVTDKEIDYLEKHIPELANSAVKKAYLDTLSKGLSVVEEIDGKLVKIFPDGKQVIIKELEKNIEINEKYFTK